MFQVGDGGSDVRGSLGLWETMDGEGGAGAHCGGYGNNVLLLGKMQMRSFYKTSLMVVVGGASKPNTTEDLLTIR